MSCVGFFTGISLTVSENRPYIILLVTPMMQRIQQMPTAADIVFVDSTTSSDVTRAVITIFLVGTKVGAIPIAILIHEQQTQARYELLQMINYITFQYIKIPLLVVASAHAVS